MAAKKLSALSTQATLADDDLVTGIDTSGATPATKNVNFTLSSLATWVLAKVATVTQEQAEAISSPETTNRWWTVQRVAQCAAAVVAANVTGLTNQWSGTRAPLGTDDGTEGGGGFSQGSLWRWNLRVWICVANTTNVASWVELTTQPSLTNPMTTAGDIIIGGTGGTPARLAAGTNGHVLTVVSGSPAYAAAAGIPPYPLSGRPGDTSFTLPISENGWIYRMDGSAAARAVTIDQQSSIAYGANAHYWICASDATNAITVEWASPVVVEGRTSPITISAGHTLFIWRASENLWFTL
jgi:hypothetical protein